ncbi:MAG: hypothetical protein ACK55K_05725, partial [Bacteroidota bacterium]
MNNISSLSKKTIFTFLWALSIVTGSAQSFTTTTTLPVDLDLGTNYASCASPGTKRFDFTIPAGLPDMDLTNFGLKLIKLSFGQCGGANYSMQVAAYLKSPSGICVKVFDGASLTSFGGNGTTQVGMVSSNIAGCLPGVNNDNLSFSQSYTRNTLDSTGNGSFFSAGVNYIDLFKNANPAGVWSLYFFETETNAPCLIGAQLDFGNIPIPIDNNANGDNCGNAIEYNGLSMCVQTNGK